MDSARLAAAEGVGTALLLAIVVGSGIMADRLAEGNVALALLANALATGTGLMVLILTFAPISGAHFNPAVTLTDRSLRGRTAGLYVLAQLGGAVLGVVLAHAMFSLPAVTMSTHVRSGWAQGLSEGVATFGLIVVIRLCPRPSVATAVGAYITAAYWFTSSTSFANPAVTMSRALTDSFAGIRPADVPMFWCAQAVGAITAKLFSDWIGS
jgi:glycerol uptake facilitator-like aquaporin